MLENTVSLVIGVGLIAFVVWMARNPKNPVWEAQNVWLGYWRIGGWYNAIWLTAFAIAGLVLVVVGRVGIAKLILSGR